MTQNALAVLCPTCAATPGAACTSYQEGTPRAPHKDRVALAQTADLVAYSTHWGSRLMRAQASSEAVSAEGEQAP